MQTLFPDIIRDPIDPVFATIIDEYKTRRGSERLGLGLEGGGAKGIWEAGALARAAEIGLLSVVDVIAGTSVGGLNALVTARYLAESPNLQKVVDLWRGITSTSSIFLGQMPSGWFSGLIAVLSGKLNAPSFLDTSPLQALARQHLGGYTKFDIPVFTITTNYDTKRLVVMSPGELAVDMALATSAVPVAFPAYKTARGMRCMDGGCVMNNPYVYLLDYQGVTKLLNFYCDPEASKANGAPPNPTTLNTGIAALAAIQQVQSDKAYLDLVNAMEIRKLKELEPIEIIHLFPTMDTGALLEFGAHPELLQAGYDDAVDYLSPDAVKVLLAA